MRDWMRLKSGSDVRGVAVAEPGAPATLTGEIGAALGVAFARWLSAKAGKPPQALTVAIGRDSRVSGEALLDAMAQGLASESVKVLDCGLCTTPAMFMSTILLSCDGAVMVTASHLPWQRNGYKFFAPDGGLTSTDIDEILALAEVIGPSRQAAEAKPVDLLSIYTDFLREMITKALGQDAPLAGLHIAVDAGNGAGGFYAQMLSALGADITGSQFLEPDGHFPNHIPNPEDAGAMQSISKAVLASGADLGVIFDADCDRAAMVDARGESINRNRLIALVVAMLLREQKGITIVTDSVTSAGLDAFITAQGGTLHRFKRGYRNVIDEAKRLNEEDIDCPLAMETSGHAALRENHFLDDGMYLMTRLIIEAQRMRAEGKQLTDLIADLREPVEACEVRLSICAEDFRQAGQEMLDGLTQAAKTMPDVMIDPGNREGLRLLFGKPDRWLMARLSVHDPLLVINTESDEAGGVKRMLKTLLAMLTPYEETVDLSALRARLDTSK